MMLTEEIKAFKDNAPCISKINNAFIDNEEVLDIVMPRPNLLEYCDNCFMTSGSLWSYYRDEVNDDGDDDGDDDDNSNNNRINYEKTITSKFFEYKTKLIRSTSN